MEHILPLSAQYGLLPREGIILCALSGGGDSIALTHFLKTQGYEVHAAHFNHLLRETAGADADLARAFCREWDIPFHYGEGEVAALGGNLEEAARTMRYDFLARTAREVGAARTATAHTANDNLETVLLHLTRGCGLRGLTGIQLRRGDLVRPMLHTTRKGVEEYLAAHHLAYATDETNFDTRFARSRVRHQVVPLLESLNPRVAEAAARMTDALREDEDCLARLAEETVKPDNFTERDLNELPGPLRYRAAPLVKRRRSIPSPAPAEVRVGETVRGPLWTLESRMAEGAPDLPPRADAFYLSREKLQGELVLRSREEGDRVHPPFRTGKTVKKWHIELGVPPEERGAWPVLTCGGMVIAAAGIGPQADFLAAPGEAAVWFQWRKAPIEMRE